MDKDIKKEFIKIFSNEMRANNVAVFAGAGLSRGSGFVDWKELLREFASSINLNIDKEHDLISIAQYYKNSSSSRFNITQKLINEFTKEAKENKTLDFITSLPISTYWTTNYDKVIENSLQKHKKIVDTKINPEDLSYSKSNKDATVYKLHGDISNPLKAIITKEDYELFDKTHELFIGNLQGDLISKTFIFIGYSLNDPDIRQILSKVRLLLGENTRTHYFFKKKVNKKEFRKKEEFNYMKIKEELEIQDLKRYGIETILIDEYSEILDIFKKIEKLYLSNNVFIAGSCRNYGEWKELDANCFLNHLGETLIKNDIVVSSGNVEGVGPQLINGVLTAINSENKDPSKYLKIKSLPLINGSDKYMDPDAKKNYQNKMISESGIIIFLFGNNFYDGNLEVSKGVLHDFARAKEQGKFIIPVGSTGWAAKKISDEIFSNIDDYQYLKQFIEKLNNTKDYEELTTLIISCINFIKDNYIF